MSEDFTPINTGSVPWGGYDWAKPSKAVLASDGDNGCVLWTVGPHVNFDISESGLGNRLDDLGLSSAPAGISIWEGITRSSFSYYGEYDSWLEGEYRLPTDEEWVAIRAGECPWDNTLWLLPEFVAEQQIGDGT